MGRKPIANIEKSIVDNALSYYAIHSKLTTSKLAEELRISEPTIFNYYKTKDGLMNACFKEAVNKITVTFKKLAVDDKTVKNLITSMVLCEGETKLLYDYVKDHNYVVEEVKPLIETIVEFEKRSTLEIKCLLNHFLDIAIQVIKDEASLKDSYILKLSEIFEQGSFY